MYLNNNEEIKAKDKMNGTIIVLNKTHKWFE